MTIDPKINQANGRLKAANIRVRVERLGSKLYLKATLPPRPDSDRVKSHQQRIALGVNATPAGLKRAEEESRIVATLIDRQQFDWTLYVKKPHTETETIADWVKRFEQDYFDRLARTPKSETTWETEYLQVFRQLPDDRPLTPDLLKQHILSKTSDTRGDAPTPTLTVWRRHLSPVKDIEIFLRGTPRCFPLRRFIVRNATRPTASWLFHCSTKRLPSMDLFVSALSPSLSYGIGQATHLNSHAFHRHTKSKIMVWGLPPA
ncbi:hypothetical protein [Phormidesmis priestleyi]